MALCFACRAIRIQLLPDSPLQGGGNEGFHQSTAGELLQSAQSCPLCGLTKTSFLRVGHFHTPAEMVEETLGLPSPLPIRLTARRKDLRRTPEGGANLTSIEVRVDDQKKFLRGQFDLFAPNS